MEDTLLLDLTTLTFTFMFVPARTLIAKMLDRSPIYYGILALSVRAGTNMNVNVSTNILLCSALSGMDVGSID